MVRRFLWVLLLAGGCTFDGAGVLLADGRSTADRAANEAGGGIDLRADVTSEAAPDFRRVDGASEDGADGGVDAVQDWALWDETVPRDQGVPDQVSPDLTRPPCATTYGGVSGFKPCQQTVTECTFYFKSGTCDAKCQAFGGTCVRAAADDSDTCTELYAVNCSATQSDGLCTCTR